ncbi:TLC domain-containing protein [Mycena pura]|uniref:TLC domain-containing protein n=1 Tax=Mycena pura TaxID=153505 RepID=A0AAD6UPL5_9AGAR|nr:TLC domain-containing protein [Mycena pura]
MTVSFCISWALSVRAAAVVVAAPVLLALPAEYLLRHPTIHSLGLSNPFTPFFLLSYPVPPPARAHAATTTAAFEGQLYIKGPADLLLLAWTIVVCSLLRLLLAHHLLPVLARRLGITNHRKLVRFGEQGYALVYFALFGAWGTYIMSISRTWWFHTAAFWLEYPHNHLPAAMKRYYLCQIAYWLQQFLVLALDLEKRRSDHWQLVLHHCVTVWMVSWSYLMNVTLLGNAVFISMDVPDAALALSKLLNYLCLARAKVVSFVVFVVLWTYFRHYLSIRILWSLWYEFEELVPRHAQIFSPRAGLYMPPWMRDQMFGALCVLQGLNLFWYYLIIRILVRSIMTSETDDNRSDDEGDDEEVRLL